MLLQLAAETVDAGPYTGIAAVAGFLVAVGGFLKVMTDRKDANGVTASALQQMAKTVESARADKVQAEANEEKAAAALEAKTQEVTQMQPADPGTRTGAVAVAEWDGEERRVERRRPSPTFVMAACAVILALAVGVSQVMTSRSAASSSAASADQAASAKTATETAAGLAVRRAVTVDALQAFQAQQACANAMFARFDAAISRAIIAEPRSAEQAAAIEELRPIAEELDRVNERCVVPHPIPDGP